jgi:hypothetical protein
MSRNIVLALYKSKLRICRAFGYRYGKWNQKYCCSLNKINKQKIKEMSRKNELGPFLWNNIRTHYKICMHSDQYAQRELLIDIGFEQLRYINYILHSFNKKRTVKLLT